MRHTLFWLTGRPINGRTLDPTRMDTATMAISQQKHGVAWSRIRGRWHVVFYGRSRWHYLRWATHPFYSVRADGRTRFLWIALGPLDVRYALDAPKPC